MRATRRDPEHRGCPDLGRLPTGHPTDLVAGADVSGVEFPDLDLDRLDLSGALVTTTRFTDPTVAEADLVGARLSEVQLDRADLPLVLAARGQWSTVTVNGRLGALEAYDARWRSVRFVGCKLGFVNLRRARLAEVEFVECDIEELDLVDAQLRRVRVVDSAIRGLDVTHARLQDVDLRGAHLASITGVTDLRGARMTTDQVTFLAPTLAAGLGIRVEQ